MEARLEWLREVRPRGRLRLEVEAEGDAVKVRLLPSSGSFILECRGLEGTVGSVEELRAVAEEAVRELGWTWMRVEGPGRLTTAFGEADRHVDVLVRGYGPEDPVREELKFDLGLRLLPGGRVQVACISRSRPLASSAFMDRAREFERAVRKWANILRVLKALGVRPRRVVRERGAVVVAASA